MPINDCSHVHEALRGANIGNINRPDLVGTINIEIPEKIRIDFRLLISLAKVWSWVEYMDTHFLHVTPEKPLSDVVET